MLPDTVWLFVLFILLLFGSTGLMIAYWLAALIHKWKGRN